MSHIVKTISERERKTHIEYAREFTYKDDDQGGYSFPCDSSGKLIHDENYDCWINNYIKCMMHPEKFNNNGIVEHRWNYTDPAYVECSCGEKFYLNGDTECPKCGQWYNGFGQSLKNPEYWDDDEY